MNRILTITGAILIFACMSITQAQVAVEARLDTNAILVGDQVDLYLTITYPQNVNVGWPSIKDTITGDIEILRTFRPDSVLDDQRSSITHSRVFTVTAFDSGFYAIPPFVFRYRYPEDTGFSTMETRPLLLEVYTLPVDLSAEIKDIREPLRAPFTFREALPWIITFILIAGAGYFIYVYSRKRKKEEPLFRPPLKISKPPFELAMDALENLKYKKLWQSGQVKEYYTELTEIVRSYLEGQFSIHALEYTTSEIMDGIQRTSVNQQARNKLSGVLTLADLVKFAKGNPTPLENDLSLNHIFDFVRESYGIVHQMEKKTGQMTPETLAVDAGDRDNEGSDNNSLKSEENVENV
ncbi:MAG: hypothetical protein JXA03_03170 [Bacteroidales bacterium]|nr:hypothetical protein [Bacteroidales bacterium]